MTLDEGLSRDVLCAAIWVIGVVSIGMVDACVYIYDPYIPPVVVRHQDDGG